MFGVGPCAGPGPVIAVPTFAAGVTLFALWRRRSRKTKTPAASPMKARPPTTPPTTAPIGVDFDVELVVGDRKIGVVVEPEPAPGVTTEVEPEAYTLRHVRPSFSPEK